MYGWIWHRLPGADGRPGSVSWPCSWRRVALTALVRGLPVGVPAPELRSGGPRLTRQGVTVGVGEGDEVEGVGVGEGPTM